MSVRTAHAKSVDELKKYDFIYSLPYFSVAENVIEDKTLVLEAFIHSHEEYEFIIPLTTIPLLCYQKANYIGEVGFIYPVNPFVDHGLEVDLHSRVISITIKREYVDKIKEQLGFKDQYFYTRYIYKNKLLDVIKSFEEEYIKNPKSNVLDDLANSITTTLVKLGLASGEDKRRPEKKYAKHMKQILLYIETIKTQNSLSLRLRIILVIQSLTSLKHSRNICTIHQLCILTREELLRLKHYLRIRNYLYKRLPNKLVIRTYQHLLKHLKEQWKCFLVIIEIYIYKHIKTMRHQPHRFCLFNYLPVVSIFGLFEPHLDSKKLIRLAHQLMVSDSAVLY